MKKKTYTNYIDFIKKAQERQAIITSFNYYDGKLTKFKAGSMVYEYIDNSTQIYTPSKFVKLCGFNFYDAFLTKHFTKLRNLLQDKEDVQKWYGGYYGGFIGVNSDIINNYLCTGEPIDIYDYDINKAYLHALTGWLPTRLTKVMTYAEYENISNYDKVIYFYFFEITLKEYEFNNGFLKCFGNLRGTYKDFDFLTTKQYKNIIVSEKRLSLINQIYFKDYTINKVYQFERGKYRLYEKILEEYQNIKDFYPETLKKDALRLYGTLGQIYKKKYDKLWFEDGILHVTSHKEVNYNCSPQVAMWVADSVAEKLFNVVNDNKYKVLSWNTDGVTAIAPLPLQVSKNAGKWKLNHFRGLPFLLSSNTPRVFYENIDTGEFIGAKTIKKKGDMFENCIEMRYTHIDRGYCTFEYKIEFSPYQKYICFNEKRMAIMRSYFTNELSRGKEQEF